VKRVVRGGWWLLIAAASVGSLAAQDAPKVDSTWLTVSPAAKTAELALIAGLTADYGGLNFNGFREGALTLTVPRGWTVVLHFRNQDAVLPHSVSVIADQGPVPAAPGAPAFRGAATAKPEGVGNGMSEDVKFGAAKAGSYLIVCAVPGHASAGMWIRLKVDAGAKTASLRTDN